MGSRKKFRAADDGWRDKPVRNQNGGDLSDGWLFGVDSNHQWAMMATMKSAELIQQLEALAGICGAPTAATTARIDAYAKRHGMSRSGFLVEAASTAMHHA